MNESLFKQIQIFNTVFKGREDVFAVRWEKEKKSGYMPAYFYDPYMYRAHKIKGGTFQNYKDKTYLKLTDKEIAKHLNGEQLIGIYPLLSDNSSWFLVADFDKENWIAEAKSFIKSCEAKGFSAGVTMNVDVKVVVHNAVLFRKNSGYALNAILHLVICIFMGSSCVIQYLVAMVFRCLKSILNLSIRILNRTLE